MNIETAFDDIFTKARDQALALLVAQAKAALPPGWSLTLPEGWWAVLRDDDGKIVTVDGLHPAVGASSKPCPRPVRVLVEAVNKFERLFKFHNEVIRPDPLPGSVEGPMQAAWAAALRERGKHAA